MLLSPLTIGQFHRVVAELPPQWHPLAGWLGVTGIRLGETAALTLDDIDSDAGTCQVAKVWQYCGQGWELRRSRCVRTVVVPGEILTDVGSTGDPELFAVAGARGVALMQGFSRAWKRAVGTAEGLDGFRPRVHDLRRMCAVRLLEAGVPVAEVAAQLGWSAAITCAQLARTVTA